MSNEQKRPDVRHLWQRQVVEGTSMSLHQLRNALAKLNRNARGRTLASGLVGLIFIGAFVALLIMAAQNPIVRGGKAFFVFRAGECLFAVLAGYWFFQVMLGLRRAPGKLLTEREPEACAAFYRSALERQRKIHRRSAVLFPLAISAVCVWGLLAARALPWAQQFRVLMIVIWVLSVPFIHFILERARMCQRELDKLNASFRH